MSSFTIDEMGMYLRKIARTPLLSRECELAIAEKVCRTRRAFLTRLLASDRALRLVLASAQRAAVRKLRIDYVVDVEGITVAARREAFTRLNEGVRVLQAALREEPPRPAHCPRRGIARRAASCGRQVPLAPPPRGRP